MPKKKNRYIIRDSSVPGVTSILAVIRKEGLEMWRGKVGNKEANRISKEAVEFGDDLHSAIDQVMSGQTIELSHNIQVAVDNLLKLTKGWKFLENEKIILNEKHMYGGTCDGIVEVDGEKYVIDFKTSSDGRGWKDHELQIVAYMDALPVKQGKLLYLNKKTLGWSEVEVEYNQDDMDVFLAAKTIWKWKNNS